MKSFSDLSDRQNGEVSMDKNLIFPLPLNKVIRRHNSIQLPNLITTLIGLVPDKWLSYLDIKPEQEIDIVMFCVLLTRYTVLLIILMYFGRSINLI